MSVKMHSSLFFLLLVLPFAFANGSSLKVSECRQYSGNCNSCLSDPNCGYCGSTEACVAGTITGPNVGNCSTWEFENCAGPSPAPSTTPAPGSLTNVWGTYGGDNSRTSYAPVTFGTLNNSSGVVTANVACVSSPVTSEDYVLCMTMPCNVVAVSLQTGSLVWNATLSTGYSRISPPFYDPKSRKVVTQVNLPNEGTLITGLDVDTGVTSWTYQDDSQWPFLPYGLVAYNGLVYAPVGSQTSYIVALRLSDGQMVWREEGYFADAGCDTWGPTVAVINGTAQVLWNKETGESYPTMVGALNAETGNKMWNASFHEAWQGYSAFWYPMYAGDGQILIAPWGYASDTSYTLLDVSASDQVTVLWQYNVTGRSIGMAVANNVFYVQSGSQILGLSSVTGSVLTVYDAAAVNGPFIVTDDSLFVFLSDSTNCVVQFGLSSKVIESTFCTEPIGSIVGFALAAKDKKLVVAGTSKIHIVGSS